MTWPTGAVAKTALVWRATDAGPGGWNLLYDDYDPTQEGNREALCTIGNGYWATRGAIAGSTADGVRYPGTYFAGVYNRTVSQIAGQAIETEHLINAADWTYLTVATPRWAGAVARNTTDAQPSPEPGPSGRGLDQHRPLPRRHRWRHGAALVGPDALTGSARSATAKAAPLPHMHR